jgi:CheY-like chemotaxis protein
MLPGYYSLKVHPSLIMSSLIPIYGQNVLLADDDEDDCLLFKDALEELSLSVHLTIVHNGEQLMQLLNEKNADLPDILFLDLNMPRKNGFECLSEIRQNEKLKQLPIIIFSTSFEQNMIERLYQQGAGNCFRKPNEFSKLKEVIYHALTITAPVLPADKKGNFLQPPNEGFVM